MPQDTSSASGFPHLELVAHAHGKPRLSGRPTPDPRTAQNRADRRKHASGLASQASSTASWWDERRALRSNAGLPTLPVGVPLLLEIDAATDLVAAASEFSFEIVSDIDDGYVIVATEELDLATFIKRVRNFQDEVRGSSVVAAIYS